MQESKSNKMGTMPMNKLLISMALPIMISMLIQALYNIVDSIFVAKISESALTAVSLAFPAQNLLIAFAGGTAVGINSLLSRSLGEGKQDRANQIAAHAIVIWLATSLLFFTIGMTCGRVFFESQTSDQSIITQGIIYFQVVVGGSIGLLGQFVFERLLQGTGRTFHTMITQGLGAIINIILDPIFIFGYLGFPAMGVLGAALATIVGQMIACALGVYMNIKYNHDIHLTFKGFQFDGHLVAAIYKIAVPSIVMQSIGSVMTYGMNLILGAFSSTAVAVFGVYFKLQSFFFMPTFGLNNALIPIVAYNYGAQNKQRMKDAVKRSLAYASCFMLLGTMLFELIPEQLLGLFNASPQLLAIGVPALRIIGFHYMFAGVGITLTAVFQAVGKSMYSLWISLIRQLVVLLPVAYLLSLSGNIHLVWWCFPISEVVSFALAIFFNQRLFHHLEF